MKKFWSLFLIFGLVFHPAFLSAAEEGAPVAKKAAVAAAEGVDNEDLAAAEDSAEDWDLGEEDTAAEDEDLDLADDTAAKKADTAVDADKAVQ